MLKFITLRFLQGLLVLLAGVGCALVEGFGAFAVSVLLAHAGQVDQGINVAGVRGAVEEGVRPLEAVPPAGSRGNVPQVAGVGEVLVGGVPKRRGWTQVLTDGTAVLFEVIRELEHRPKMRCGFGGRCRVAGRAALRTGHRAA